MARTKSVWKNWGDHPFVVIISLLIGIIGITINVFPINIRQNQNDISNSRCVAFQENGGTVVMDADQYTVMLPGKEHSLSKSQPNRNASGITWQKNQNFPGTLKVLPDIQHTNTMSDTNGPALVYLINFRKVGTYFVYIRGFGSNGNGDSIHVGLSGQAVTTKFENGFTLESSLQEPRWFWKTEKDEAAVIEIPHPGLYAFYIWARENGVNVQRIWLDANQDNVQNGETGEELASSQCVNSL